MDALQYQKRLGRAAGVVALALATVFVASILIGPGSVLHSDPDTHTALATAAQQGGGIKLLGFLDGLVSTLFAVLIVLLVGLAGPERVFSPLAYVGAGAAAGIQWTHAGMMYALAELAHRGGADAGVLALFTLGSTMDDADGIVIPLAMASAAVLLLRSHAVPTVIAWLTFVVAGIGAGLTLVTVAGGPDLGPATVIASWIWLLALGITLVVRPSRGEVLETSRGRYSSKASA